MPQGPFNTKKSTERLSILNLLYVLFLLLNPFLLQIFGFCVTFQALIHYCFFPPPTPFLLQGPGLFTTDSGGNHYRFWGVQNHLCPCMFPIFRGYFSSISIQYSHAWMQEAKTWRPVVCSVFAEWWLSLCRVVCVSQSVCVCVCVCQSVSQSISVSQSVSQCVCVCLFGCLSKGATALHLHVILPQC